MKDLDVIINTQTGEANEANTQYISLWAVNDYARNPKQIYLSYTHHAKWIIEDSLSFVHGNLMLSLEHNDANHSD